ncbi:MAG: hypothetical protein JWO86_6529, partial [Myxococcaceae bacterium]|nr:hypothetical protein [Myxococcaceae bacterium]
MRSLLLLGALVAASALAACGSSPATTAPKTSASVAPVVPRAATKLPSFGADAIDAALHDAWQKQGLAPAPRTDDATFVRRAYVDIIGTIPQPDATAAFIEGTAPDKRAKLVEALIASPQYAEHWMNYWDDVLMGRETKGPVVDRVAFRYWLRARFEANAPWDRMVRDLVSATGQNSIGGRRVRVPQAQNVP